MDGGKLILLLFSTTPSNDLCLQLIKKILKEIFHSLKQPKTNKHLNPHPISKHHPNNYYAIKTKWESYEYQYMSVCVYAAAVKIGKLEQ